MNTRPATPEERDHCRKLAGEIKSACEAMPELQAALDCMQAAAIRAAKRRRERVLRNVQAKVEGSRRPYAD